MMKRREFITLLGGAAVALPLAARAQQPDRTYRLGFFLPVARDAPAIIAFFDELRVHGFVEGQISQLFQEVSRPVTSSSTTWCRRLSRPHPMRSSPEAMSSRAPSRTRRGQFRLWSLPRTWSRLVLRPRLPTQAAISPVSA
jgi:hypothetical protein